MSDPLKYLIKRGETYRTAEAAIPKITAKLKDCEDKVYSLTADLEEDCLKISFEGESKEFRFGYRNGGLETGSINDQKSWKFKLDGDPVSGSIESTLTEIIENEF